MRAVLLTTNPVEQNFAEVLLADAGIAHVVFDLHALVIEGSIGAFIPRRLMVDDDDYRAAVAALAAGMEGYVPP